MNFIYRLLARPSKHDGRSILAIIVAVYFLTIYLSSFFMDYAVFWKLLGVPATNPSFADMAFVSHAIEKYHDATFDVYEKQAFTYPKIWLRFSSFWPSENHTVPLAVGMCAVYYLCIFLFLKRITVVEGLLYGFLLCASPL